MQITFEKNDINQMSIDDLLVGTIFTMDWDNHKHYWYRTLNHIMRLYHFKINDEYGFHPSDCFNRRGKDGPYFNQMMDIKIFGVLKIQL